MFDALSVEMKGLVSGDQQAVTRATVGASNYQVRCIMQRGLRLFREEPVSLVLVELRTPGMDRLDLIRMLHHTHLRAKIIAMAGGIGD
ncbi:MAG: hypothetical protein H8K03_13785 [Nitrospira sp.]